MHSDFFANASGLNIKQNADVSFLTEANLVISSFPCKYLGFPLH
jgi:hypothetical protein